MNSDRIYLLLYVLMEIGPSSFRGDEGRPIVTGRGQRKNSLNQYVRLGSALFLDDRYSPIKPPDGQYYIVFLEQKMCTSL